MRLGTVVCFCAAVLSAAGPSAWGVSRTFDFQGSAYGVPDESCTNSPVPPLLNRPEYGSQTAGFIVDPAGCGKGTLTPLDFGSDALLTAQFPAPGSNWCEELRFSWVDPNDSNTWLRTLSYAAQAVTPKFQAPIVHFGNGSKISMKVAVGAFDINGASNPAGQIELCLIIRETGQNLPLGEQGAASGYTLEFVGATSALNAAPFTPDIGAGARLTDAFDWYTVEWAFGADNTKVDVTVTPPGGSPTTTQMSIVSAFNTGNGVLSAANNRGTLDGIAFRKVASDTVTKKWFVNIDDIVIDAPGVLVDPVKVRGPVTSLHTKVSVDFINASATAVKLYQNGSLVKTADASSTPPLDAGSGTYQFSGLTLAAGDVLTATQVVGGIEGDPSDGVTVGNKLVIDDFTAGVTWTRTPATAANFGEWYEVNSVAYGTASAGTLDGSAALRYVDSGFMNGFYAIYQGVVPATGSYQLTADMHINEGSPTGFTQFQVGVIVNGVHRDTASCQNPGCYTNACHNQSLLAVDTTKPGNAVGFYQGLTDGDDTGLPTQTVTTGEFTANEGDNILVVFSTNVESQWSSIPLDSSGRLDTLDPCETPSGFPPVAHPVPNAQGTWNVKRNDAGTGRVNTSVGWSGSSIYVDNICLVKPIQCTQTAPVTVQGPLVAGMTQVTVTGVDPTASVVKVYKNGAGPEIGSAPGNGTGTVVVTVSALVDNDIISATQTVDHGSGPVEGCIPTVGIKVGDCAQIGPVTVVTPIKAGETVVRVSGVSGSASAVTVYRLSGTTYTQIGQNTSPAAGTNNVTVSPPLTKGEVLVATQTIATLEGCKPTAGPMVGSGGNTAIRLSLGIRENTSLTGPAGEDGGSTGAIEWIIPDDPNDAGDGQVVGGVPQGVLINPSPNWQTVTFNPTGGSVIKSFNAGNDVLDGTWGVLEHLAIASAGADTGPYVMYIDNVTSPAGDPAFEDFESYADAAAAMFRQPSTSGTTQGNMYYPPNTSQVDAAVGDASSKSLRVEWFWKDEAATRWIRLTTIGPIARQNPQVRLDQPIMLRILFPPPCQAPTIASVTPDKGNVDATVSLTIAGTNLVPGGTTVLLKKTGQADIAATNVVVAGDGLSLTADVNLTGAALGLWDVVVTTCASATLVGGFEVKSPCNTPPADVDGDGDVDLTDFGVFQACFNGPNRPWPEPPVDQQKCACLDGDKDLDVDLSDFGTFQTCFNGPNRPPACP